MCLDANAVCHVKRKSSTFLIWFENVQNYDKELFATLLQLTKLDEDSLTQSKPLHPVDSNARTTVAHNTIIVVRLICYRDNCGRPVLQTILSILFVDI